MITDPNLLKNHCAFCGYKFNHGTADDFNQYDIVICSICEGMHQVDIFTKGHFFNPVSDEKLKAAGGNRYLAQYKDMRFKLFPKKF